MSDAWIEINEGSGPRRVPIEKAVFTAGRRAGNDLKLSAADIAVLAPILILRTNGEDGE